MFDYCWWRESFILIYVSEFKVFEVKVPIGRHIGIHAEIQFNNHSWTRWYDEGGMKMKMKRMMMICESKLFKIKEANCWLEEKFFTSWLDELLSWFVTQLSWWSSWWWENDDNYGDDDDDQLFVFSISFFRSGVNY